MKSDQFEEYHRYLKQKSTLGNIYRKTYLFPKLKIYTKGLALDVGCGTGEFSLSRANTHATDINPVNIEYLKSRGINAFLLEKDHIPAADEIYDTVLMDNVLEHIEKPQPLLHEIHRVLKSNGRFIVGVPGIKGFASEEDHKVFYNEENLVPLLLNFGFKKSKIFFMPMRSEYLNQKMRQYCLYGVFEKNS